MARPKSREDVELARIDAETERARIAFDRLRLICHSVIYCFLITAGVATISILSWTFIKVTDRPPWLQALLAVIPLVPLSWITWSQRRDLDRYRRQVAWLKARAERPDLDDADAAGGTDEP